MNNRYVITFSKTGYAKYTSHLDLLRVFKRSFKKNDLALRYSQGFNPHPKMSFAQPLSLGYTAAEELIEFETASPHKPEEICEKLEKSMPEGINILECKKFDAGNSSLAAEAIAAEYEVTIPTDIGEIELNRFISDYLSQRSIIAMKRQKKTKKLVETDIKPKIRRLTCIKGEKSAVFSMLLDCGSISNCSPELVINTFCKFAGIEAPRYEIDVERKKILFSNKLQF